MRTLTFFRRRRAPLGIVVAIAVLAVASLIGCDDDIFNTVDEDKLSPPLGLTSITGNEDVTLTWFTSNFEGGFEGYFVFMAEGEFATDESQALEELNAAFVKVDSLEFSSSSSRPQSSTIRNLTNGTTYSFAVVAFQDDGGEISRTSNIVEDTPRPDITSITLTSASTADVTGNDLTAGFDFDGFDIEAVPTDLSGANYMNATGTDMVHEAFDPGPANANIRSWMAGMNGGGVQDLGFMSSLDGSDRAPEEGYAGNGESVLLTVGHVYAVRTGENPPRYGKIIVTSIESPPIPRVTFNAAFQTKDNDPNYFRALGIDR
jgi:hypothetical protein